MDNEIIDSAIADVNVEQPQDAVETPQIEQEASLENNEQPQEERDPWPKTAKNALARREKQIAKMRSKYDALESEVRELRSLVQNGGKPKDGMPTEDQFDNYSDYLMARAEAIADQKIQKALAEKAVPPKEAQQQQWMEQRTQEIAQSIPEIAKQIPDLVETIDEYTDDIDELPENIQLMMLHSENPTMAAYNLIKSGRLERLANLPEAMAAAEIMQAAKYSPVKKISEAPAPVKPVRGVGSGRQSVDNMGVEDVLKAFIK